MSEMVDKGKEFGEKAKALADAGIEKLKGVDWKAQGIAAKDGVNAAKVKIVATWNSGKVGKFVCVIGAVLLIWIGSCVLHTVSGGMPYKTISKDNLIFTTLPTLPVEKNVGYPYIGAGLKVLQWLPNEKAVIAVLDWGGNMGLSDLAIKGIAMQNSGLAGGAFLLNELQEKGQPIYLKTMRTYVDGANIERGIFVYDGIETYKTRNGTLSVRSFVEIDPKIADEYFREQKEISERAKKEAEEREEKEMTDRFVCDGYTLKLPDSLKVKSLCGVAIGIPPKEYEKKLGDRIERSGGGCDGGKYMLKKSFRVFNKAEITTTVDEAPFRVVVGIKLTGRLDPSKYSKDSCRGECEAVEKILKEKFGIPMVREEINGNNISASRFINDKIFGSKYEAEDCHKDCNVGLYCWHKSADDDGAERYEFSLDVDARYIVNDALGELQRELSKKNESKKAQKLFDSKEGADVL